MVDKKMTKIMTSLCHFFGLLPGMREKMQVFCQMCENSILEPDTLVLGILDIIKDIILEIVNAYMYKR